MLIRFVSLILKRLVWLGRSVMQVELDYTSQILNAMKQTIQ